LITSVVSKNKSYNLPIQSAKRLLSKGNTLSLKNYIKSGTITINKITITIGANYSLERIAKIINASRFLTKIEAKIVINAHGDKTILLLSSLPVINIVDHNKVLFKLYQQNLLGKSANDLIKVIKKGPTINQDKVKINYKLKPYKSVLLSSLSSANKLQLSKYVAINERCSRRTRQQPFILHKNRLLHKLHIVLDKNAPNPSDKALSIQSNFKSMALQPPILINDTNKITSSSSAMLLGTTISQAQAIETKTTISTMFDSDMLLSTHAITGIKKLDLQQLNMGTKITNTTDTMQTPSTIQLKALMTETISTMFVSNALPSTHVISGQQEVTLKIEKATTMSNSTASPPMVPKSNKRTLPDGMASKITKPRKFSTTHVVNNAVDLAKERRDALKLMRLKNKEFLFKMNRVYQLTEKQRQEFGLKRAKESVAWTMIDKKKVETIYSNYFN